MQDDKHNYSAVQEYSAKHHKWKKLTTVQTRWRRDATHGWGRNEDQPSVSPHSLLFPFLFFSLSLWMSLSPAKSLCKTNDLRSFMNLPSLKSIISPGCNNQRSQGFPRGIIPVKKDTFECIRANRNMLWAVNALDDCLVEEGEGGLALDSLQKSSLSGEWTTFQSLSPVKCNTAEILTTSHLAQPVTHLLWCGYHNPPLSTELCTCCSSPLQDRNQTAERLSHSRPNRNSAAKQGLGARWPILPASHLMSFLTFSSVRNHTVIKGKVEKKKGGSKEGWWEIELRTKLQKPCWILTVTLIFFSIWTEKKKKRLWLEVYNGSWSFYT